jgi:predicted choloylglycine hydrolase
MGIMLTFFLISTSVLTLNVQTLKTELMASEISQNSNAIATYGKGYLENFSDLLVLHVRGSPYEMGYQNGFLLKDLVQAMIQARIQKMIDMGYSYEYQVNCSQAMESHIPQEFIEEMHGLADGAVVNYTDVLLLHIHPDMQYYGTGWTGCSGFAVFGNATIDNHLYHGRNEDIPLPSQPCGLVTVHKPENGNILVNVGHFGFIGLSAGMNKRGISIGLKLSSSSDKTLDGMPILLMLRQVLQYSNNLIEAINILNQTDRTTGWNVLLGDGSNLNACAVEMSDNYCKVFWAEDPAEDVFPHYGIKDAVRRTNHFVDTELSATQRSPYDPRDGWNWSWSRYEKLSEIILGNHSNIDSDLSIQFLQTYPVGGYLTNLQSVVFDSTDLELWVANANSTTPAHSREYIHLSYTDLFITPVGGISIPVDNLSLLAPYVALTVLLAATVVAVVYVKKRKRNPEINS